MINAESLFNAPLMSTLLGHLLLARWPQNKLAFIIPIDIITFYYVNLISSSQYLWYIRRSNRVTNTVERLSCCHLGSGASLHCHLCDIYFPAGVCDAVARGTRACLNECVSLYISILVCEHKFFFSPPSVPFRLKAVQTTDVNWLQTTIFDLHKQQRMCNKSGCLLCTQIQLHISQIFTHNSNGAIMLVSTSFILTTRFLKFWNDLFYLPKSTYSISVLPHATHNICICWRTPSSQALNC